MDNRINFLIGQKLQEMAEKIDILHEEIHVLATRIGELEKKPSHAEETRTVARRTEKR